MTYTHIHARTTCSRHTPDISGGVSLPAGACTDRCVRDSVAKKCLVLVTVLCVKQDSWLI